MSVRLREQVPAFRIGDDVLDRLWRGVEAKWAGEEPTEKRLTVRETVRVAGRRAPEEHDHHYESADELLRPPDGPGVLRNYTLTVSSWGKESREVRFGTYGGGRAATVEVTAADAAWCREVVDAVLEQLRPHTLWYAAVHRISSWAPIAAAVPTLVGTSLATDWGFPQVAIAVFALYMSFLVLLMCRAWLFPAADIHVRRRGTQPVAPDRGSRESSGRDGAEPARRARGGVVDLSDHRERRRREGGGTTSS